MNTENKTGEGRAGRTNPDYGSKGLIGVLTPQANTTVEPELWSLLPSGWSMLNARLTSSRDTIESRLLDYTEKYVDTASQFANAPIAALAIACTGTSYLLTDDRENEIVEQISQRFGIPCVTAAQGTVSMLKALGVSRVALLSPYPESLNVVSTRYWQSKGFDIVEKAGPDPSDTAFHPIYSMSGNAVYAAYRRLADTNADAVLMLGTGMPTLGPILAGIDGRLKTALSCNLALAWAVVNAASDAAVDPGEWLSGALWRERFESIRGQ